MAVSMSRRRIVVVDASRHLRGMICDVLRNAGFTDMLQAANSEELLQLVEQSRLQFRAARDVDNPDHQCSHEVIPRYDPRNRR